MFSKLKKIFGKRKANYNQILVMTPYLSNELTIEARNKSAHEGIISLTYRYDEAVLPDIKKALTVSVKDMMDVAFRWNQMVEKNETKLKGDKKFETLSISRAYLTDTTEAIRGMPRLKVDDLTNRYVNGIRNAKSLEELLELPAPLPSLRKRRLFCMLKALD